MTAAPDHTTRAHSKLGASVAHRWMNCPGSIRRCAGIEDQETIFAAEGTAAHELAEKALRYRSKTVSAFIDEPILVGNHKFVVDEEMAEAVQLYFDTVMDDYEDGDLLLIEVKFDLSEVYEGMFGTGDAALYKRRTKALKVFDYKHGKGYAVEAENNPQLAYYGVGCVKHPDLAGLPIDEVELVIVQPRAPHKDGPVRRWKTDALHLIDFMADLRAAAVATTAPDAPLVAGAWCKFCPAAGVCDALKAESLRQAEEEFGYAPPDGLTDDELASIVEKADLVQGWIKAVFQEAFNRLQAGQKVPGWKLVQKRATRKWRGEEDDLALDLQIELGLSEQQIFARKLLSPAKLEALLPKGDRKLLEQFVVKESSGTTLAREADRRAEVQPSRSAADDFDPVE